MSQNEIQDLERLAEFEIKRLDDLQRRSGATPWLLAAAVAAVIWRALESAPKIHDLVGIGVFVACATVLIDSARGIWSTASSRLYAPSATPRFFHSTWILAGSQGQILLRSFTPVVAVSVIWWKATPQGWVAWVWIVVTVNALFGAIGGLLLCTYEFFITGSSAAASHGFKAGIRLRTIVELPAAITAVIIGWPLLHTHLGDPETQVAVLLIAVWLLVDAIAGYYAYDPVRATYEDIRRSITLGEISYDQAKSRLEIAARGHTAEALLRERLDDFLKKIAAVDEAQRTVEAAITRAREQLPTDRRKVALAAMDDSVAALGRSVNQAERAEVGLTVRMQLLGMMDKRVAPELTKVLSDVSAQVAAAKTKAKKLREEGEKIRSEFESGGGAGGQVI